MNMHILLFTNINIMHLLLFLNINMHLLLFTKYSRNDSQLIKFIKLQSGWAQNNNFTKKIIKMFYHKLEPK